MPLSLALEEVDIIWSTGTSDKPVDAVVIEQVFDEPGQGLVGSTYALAAIGLIACILTLMLIINTRHLRYMKMSSPVFNNVILIGCGFGYISIFLLGISNSSLSDLAFSSVCHLRVAFLMIAFTLAFGSLFAKVSVFRTMYKTALSKYSYHCLQWIHTDMACLQDFLYQTNADSSNP